MRTPARAALTAGAAVAAVGLVAYLLGRSALSLHPIAAIGLLAAATGVAALLAARVAASVVAQSHAAARELEHGSAAGRTPSAVPVPRDQDLARLVLAVNQALDHSLAARREVERRERRAAAVIDLAPNGVALFDSEGVLVVVNRAFREMLRLRGDVMGRPVAEVLAPSELRFAIDDVRGGEPASEAAVIDGGRDLLLRALAMPGGGVLAVLQDVTRYRTAERARRDFVANVSHELRTPVASILGYAETLIDDPGLEPGARALVETILRNGRRLRDLFEDLLELSRIEARRDELPMGATRVWPVLEAVADDLRELVEARGHQLALEGPRDAVGIANREALETIVSNLARNACMYTPSGGHVTLRVNRRPDTLRIEVIDDGIGIPADQQQRIFERFYRVDAGRSRAAGGTGLGLAIVKHLALASGWAVGIESAPGQGSMFWVDLEPAEG